MLLSLPELIDRTHDLYRSKSALRRKWQIVDETIHNQHAIQLPEGVLSRAEVVYSGEAYNRMARAKVLLSDPDGPLVSVSQNGTSDTARRAKARMQAWQQAGLRKFEKIVEDRVQGDGLREDMITKSMGVIRIMPDFAAWDGLPGAPEMADFDESALDSPEDFADKVEHALLRLDAVSEAQRRYKETHDPIQMQWVPARSFIPVVDVQGLCEAYEIQTMPVQQVLSSFVDAEGRPLAKGLAEQFGYYEDPESGSHGYYAPLAKYSLTDEDVCTVVIRSDRVHMQIVVTDLIPDDEPQTGYTRRATAGHDEQIWYGEHQMGEVPYAFGRGRTTSMRDDVFYYSGFLDPAIHLFRALDNAMSQEATIVRIIGWPVYYVYRTEMGMGGGDRPLALPVVEGEIYNGLRAGEEIRPIQQIAAQTHEQVSNYIQRLLRQIDALTLGQPSMGQPAGPSGYQFALQITQDQSVLEPWETGLSRLYADACRLRQRAAQALEAAGFGPIPVRYVGSEGVEYVTVDRDLLEVEWDYEVQVKTKPVGGEMALVQTLEREVDRGWETDDGAMERLGKRSPQNIREQRLVELYAQSPKIREAVETAIAAQILSGAQNMAPGGLPGQAIIPPALARVLGQAGQSNALLASLAAKTPEQGYGGMAGLPDMGKTAAMAGMPAPGTGMSGHGSPQFSYDGGRGGGGGNPVGQALAAPGGAIRNSAVAGAA